MRTIRVVFLYCAYLCLALTAGLWAWRTGGGWGAGVAASLGALAFCFAVHGMISRGADRKALRRDVTVLREAHVILADQIEQMQARFDTLSTEVHEEAEGLTGEMRMLEDMIQRLSHGRLEIPPPPDSDLYAPPVVHDARTALLDTIKDALSENRVDLYLQPVVSLPQRRTVFYESFSRLRDETGRIMMPAEYLSVAEPEGLVSAIDNLLLFRCVQIVRRLARQDRKIGIFCNLSLSSLADEVFFPQFLEFLADNKDLHGALVFELGQEAFRQRGSVEARNMAKLADLGFQFSLDKVTDLDFDFQDLQRSDVKFVKISAETLLSELLEVEGQLALKSMRDLAAADFADMMRRYGVEVIAEKIESERHVIDVLELNIAHGQGHLFGQPRAIREAVLAEADTPPGFANGLARRVAGAR